MHSETRKWVEDSIRNEYFFTKESSEFNSLWREYFSIINKFSKELNTLNTSKEVYLDWVKTWRMFYSKLSYESRMCKKARKTTKFSNSHAEYAAENARRLKTVATSMMHLRAESKEFAEESYLKEHKEKSEIAA